MKVKLNPMFEQASGSLGDLVFREVNGVTIAGRKPSFTGDPTPEQAAVCARFKQAAAYGKSVMADSSLRALYETAAKSKNMPLFALTVADYFNEPTVESVDVSAYFGQVGNLIKINASDDFGVASVSVSIADSNGVIEFGMAAEKPAGSGHWEYIAKDTVAAGTAVTINVVATDNPGGTATSTTTKTL